MHPALSILLPTRGRPDRAEQFLRSVAEMSADPANIEIILYVDKDDPASHAIDCEAIPVIRIIGPSLTMGGLNTACYRRSTGDIIVPLNDDMIIRTPDWDRKIRDVHDRFPDGIYLAYPNDLHAGETFPSTPILSRTTCQRLISPYPEVYAGGFIDYHLMDIFKRLQVLGENRVVYLKDLVIEHMHPQYGKAETDATYRRRGPLDVGDDVFIGLRGYRQKAAQRLASAIKDQPSPDLPDLGKAPLLPDNDFLAVGHFLNVFLADGAIPLHWRAHLFEVLTRRHFLKKYKYPEPAWQYKLLKALAPLLKWPFQFIQKFK
ncbi:MAG: hypothetical protein OEZ51_08850 [Nitrospinota bacterium]|nr:hypothetical protein [Nitrospinota bacterium]